MKQGKQIIPAITKTLLTIFISAVFIGGTCEGLVERNTNNGTVIGQHYLHNGLDSYRFLGIPYAKPPTGNNRFRPPQNASNYPGGELEAFEYPPHCIQQGFGAIEGSEDCLYLNIWTPEGTDSGDKKPVMFFLHGGANEVGRTDQTIENFVSAVTLPATNITLATFLEPLEFPMVDVPMYDGHFLASQHDVVVVTINYRLGSFGHLSHPSLGTGSGNFTFLDILKALEWIQANIESFGGNKDNVMLFGESAGAWNTCAMMFMPAAEGLFHKAGMQSQSCQGRTVQQAETAGDVVIANAGCTNASDIAGCLRQAPAHVLANGSGLGESEVPNKFIPTIDGDVFPTFFIEALDNGTFNDVPLIIGTNIDEYIFPADTDDNFNCPLEGALSIFNGQFDAPIYKYRFDHKPFIPLVVPAFHASELPYVFGTAEDMFFNSFYDMDVSDDMVAYWTSFAHYSNPNGGGMLNWPEWNQGSQYYMRFKTFLELGQGSSINDTANCNNPFPDRIKYW